VTCEQPVRSSDFILIQLVVPGFDVDQNELVFVFFVKRGKMSRS
jgi:hypothetical protein